VSVLVTGGTGFVGLNVIEALLARDEHVVVLDQRTMPSQFLTAIGPKSDLLSIEIANVCDSKAVQSVFSRHAIQQVFLGAAITAGPERELNDPQSVLDVNLRGNLNVLQAAGHAGVKRVVFPSSLTVYGESLHDREVVDEATTPPVPEGLYGITKYAAERLVLRMASLLKFEVVAGRIGTVFGPWETFTGARDLVSPLAQIARAYTLATPVVLPLTYPRREMIYSRDLARALVLLMFAPRLSHQVYNLSTNSNWNKTPEAWCEALSTKFLSFNWQHTNNKSPATIDYYDLRHRASLNTDRVKEDLGFVSAFELPLAVENYAHWLEANMTYFQTP
jgi:UDP-glucose 4-epimerase